jgi:hypothetical protein
MSIRIREWNGDSRGHWEGNTLVVDTTNLRPAEGLPSGGSVARREEGLVTTGSPLARTVFPWARCDELGRADTRKGIFP